MRFKQRILYLLKQAGLTPSEAKFFLAAHNNPEQTIYELQKKSKLSRTSAYRAFENLKERGLLTSSPENWRKKIGTVSLHTLADKLGKERRRLGKIEMELKSIDKLVNLKGINNDEPLIEILTDQNKITEKSYKIVHQPWDRIFCYGSAERLLDIVGENGENYFRKQRVRSGKKVNVILTEQGDYAEYLVSNNEKELRNIKFHIDTSEQGYLTYMYDDEITIWQKDKILENRAIVISDPLMVNMYTNMFHCMWKKM